MVQAAWAEPPLIFRTEFGMLKGTLCSSEVRDPHKESLPELCSVWAISSVG